MATKEEFTFLSDNGKTNIHCVKWMPDNGEYKGILQITHGMIEYIERYNEFASFIADNGFLVVGHDHLGHGQSVNSQEEWGFFHEDRPCNVLIADMHTLRTMIQKDNKDVPYFMLGHSMGSYMLRKYAALYNLDLNGIIIMGTGFVEPKTTMSGLKLVKFLTKIYGSKHRSKFVTNMTFGKPYKKYDLTGQNTKNSWLTKDEVVVQKYYSDPRCTFTFTLNGYQGLLEAVLSDCRLENVDRIPKNISVFLVSGKDDPVGDFGEGVQKVYDLFELTNHKDLKMKLYENDRHEILNETDKKEVYEDILNWINERCKLQI
ncbi:Lysophospholipase, alpha-beta hydrolase superfamily [Lachnospiraceae bacterium C7]|nr:Lysophospholipase, alpha-beta hydrolase superfamily [Lachnospiraceae bacterium C7]